MNRDDRFRLEHMLDASRQAVQYLAGRKHEDIYKDPMLTDSVIKCLMVVGEAAAHISKEGRASAPGVPWKTIVGMRNWLIHAYYDVNLETVWETATPNLPDLIARIERILAEQSADGVDQSEPA